MRLRIGDVEEVFAFAIQPAKITEAAFERLLQDLETQLPAAIALGLQRVGGLTGLKLLPQDVSTRAQELQRLRRAVLGHDGRPGLAQILVDLTADPYRVLHSTQVWVSTDRARRPVPNRLMQAIAAGQNLDESGLPRQILDAQVDQTYDVYENQLVKSFHSKVRRRLTRLLLSLGPQLRNSSIDQADPLRSEAEALRSALSRGRRSAVFLDNVSELHHPPDRISMVLLHRAAYRAAVEGYYEFLRSIWVRMDDLALEAPLENFPYLYETWGTLRVLSVLINLAAEHGFVQLGEQHLVRRDAEGLYVRLIPAGHPSIVMVNPSSGTILRFFPQRAYASSGPITSISFTQVPDVTIEVRPLGGSPILYLFDAKYKLDSELLEVADGRPKKEDIDKMHAYRDAIRSVSNERVVRYAAILYPGPTETYRGPDSLDVEVAALRSDPEHAEELEQLLRDVLVPALT